MKLLESPISICRWSCLERVIRPSTRRESCHAGVQRQCQIFRASFARLWRAVTRYNANGKCAGNFAVEIWDRLFKFSNSKSFDKANGVARFATVSFASNAGWRYGLVSKCNGNKLRFRANRFIRLAYVCFFGAISNRHATNLN